jgi:hypothetical protein
LLKDLRQIGALHGAWIMREPLLARTVRGDLIDECEELFVPPVLRDQQWEPVLAPASALGAVDPEHVELADQVAEEDRAVAGHGC